ncbi:hypothetical protein K7X08_029669 [Anisodus acutangulus]|uniref:Uncharacterized protein n=1 Tax=Anisodus acutangulus TaxID=402998 RepID=A0A9Q1QU05_9SOLA|nr:hypothetical protein K7X08_029669 [Anisodus acutangulus]
MLEDLSGRRSRYAFQRHKGECNGQDLIDETLAENELVKIDIICHIKGDAVLAGSGDFRVKLIKQRL